MIVQNYTQLYGACQLAFPNKDEFHSTYRLSGYRGLDVIIAVPRGNAYFLCQTSSPDGNRSVIGPTIIINASGAEPTGAMAESTEALPSFLDWLADQVGAARPVWVKTDHEILLETVGAMTAEELHEAMQDFLKGKDKQGWKRMTTCARATYYASGKVEWEDHYRHAADEIDVLREIVQINMARKARRSKSAKKAAETRARRHHLRVHNAALALVTSQNIGPLRQCYCCGKKLDDTVSIERGIGPECWQQVLTTMEQVMAEGEQA